jgi:predicted DNA-binding protein (MmcQ/YjbR family)
MYFQKRNKLREWTERMTYRELIDLCLEMPQSYEDYPFGDDNNWCVVRHTLNRKCFVHIHERDGKLYANLKCDPLESDFLRQTFADISPAYHMNKTHWNGVFVNGDVPIEELKRLIENSYDLVRPKVRKRRNND